MTDAIENLEEDEPVFIDTAGLEIEEPEADPVSNIDENMDLTFTSSTKATASIEIDDTFYAVMQELEPEDLVSMVSDELMTSRMMSMLEYLETEEESYIADAVKEKLWDEGERLLRTSSYKRASAAFDKHLENIGRLINKSSFDDFYLAVDHADDPEIQQNFQLLDAVTLAKQELSPEAFDELDRFIRSKDRGNFTASVKKAAYSADNDINKIVRFYGSEDVATWMNMGSGYAEDEDVDIELEMLEEFYGSDELDEAWRRINSSRKVMSMTDDDIRDMIIQEAYQFLVDELTPEDIASFIEGENYTQNLDDIFVDLNMMYDPDIAEVAKEYLYDENIHKASVRRINARRKQADKVFDILKPAFEEAIKTSKEEYGEAKAWDYMKEATDAVMQKLSGDNEYIARKASNTFDRVHNNEFFGGNYSDSSRIADGYDMIIGKVTPEDLQAIVQYDEITPELNALLDDIENKHDENIATYVYEFIREDARKKHKLAAARSANRLNPSTTAKRKSRIAKRKPHVSTRQKEEIVDDNGNSWTAYEYQPGFWAVEGIDSEGYHLSQGLVPASSAEVAIEDMIELNQFKRSHRKASASNRQKLVNRSAFRRNAKERNNE